MRFTGICPKVWGEQARSALRIVLKSLDPGGCNFVVEKLIHTVFYKRGSSRREESLYSLLASSKTL